MKAVLRALVGGYRAELIQLRRSPLLIALTVVQSITFIFLVYFFGTTGAFAPTALVDNDKGYYAKELIDSIDHAHHSFALKFMDEEAGYRAIKKEKLAAMIIIPEGFSEAYENGETIPLKVIVDNIDTDMTMDIQRALPAAITHMGNKFKLPAIRVQTAEYDLIDHDTGFIPYLVTSALALSAFIVAGILGAVTVAREFESKTAQVLIVSPINPMIPLVGKVLATSMVSVATMLIAVGIVVIGHGITPIWPLELAAALLSSIIVFGFMGAAFGAGIKRTLPVASLIFGIALPLYLFSGTYEPEGFDGLILWRMAHFTPLYYAVGILEHAVLDLRVTPESVGVNFMALGGWTALFLAAMRHYLRRTES